MFKLLRLGLLVLMLWGAFTVGGLIRERNTLSEDVIRLHVVAASDSDEDQKRKLAVRDAVIQYLEQAMGQFHSAEEAKQYLLTQLEQIRQVATQALQRAGCDDSVSVSLEQEEFDTREYETFTLPAGVYDALRIVIGAGDGKNWWCVVFPRLCTPASAADFEDTAAGAGFSDRLTQTVRREPEYELRFWVLDFIGRLQNLLFG